MRAFIKSVPFLYSILVPGIRLVDRAKVKLHRHALERFRKFCAAVPHTASEPIFVKVGANDGVTGDPCSDLLLADMRRKGLLIEPVPYCFQRLSSRFHDPGRFNLEQVAIGTPAGQAIFYYVDPAAREKLPHLPPWFDQLGSFDKHHILKHLDGVLAPFIVECEVEVRPLTDVLRKHGIGHAHLLHIDTEGHDYEVLKTLDFASHAPVAIFVEHKHLSEAKRAGMLQLLRKHGYSVRDCGGDYFALDRTRLRRTAQILRR